MIVQNYKGEYNEYNVMFMIELLLFVRSISRARIVQFYKVGALLVNMRTALRILFFAGLLAHIAQAGLPSFFISASDILQNLQIQALFFSIQVGVCHA